MNMTSVDAKSPTPENRTMFLRGLALERIKTIPELTSLQQQRKLLLINLKHNY